MKFRILAIYLGLSIIAFFMVLPFYWMVTTALKTPLEAIKFPPTWIPHNFVWQNFVHAWRSAPFGRYFLNSIIITVGSTIGVLVTAALAGYALGVLNFPGRGGIFMLLLATMMIPMPVYIVPDYLILTRLGWIDTYKALIIPWIASTFSIFLLRQYFKSIPRDLYEAGLIDGCNHFMLLWRIALPLVKPALAAIAIFSAVSSWNSFIWPLVMTNSPWMRTVQVGLGYFLHEESTNYTLLAAASTIAALPIIILFVFAQRAIIETYMRSGRKG